MTLKLLRSLLRLRRKEEPERKPESEEWPPYLVPYRVRLLDGGEVEVLAWPCAPLKTPLKRSTYIRDKGLNRVESG